ncbi:hypothetical protein ABZM97_09565 [Bacillus vallismortis]|uniref:hypothetical protein n=1 Tax=Bacillus vallismortis TaxID=72361 RepID=UPI0034604A79
MDKSFVSQKEKESLSVTKQEAKKIINALIFQNQGKTIFELRKATLDFLKSNVAHENVIYEVKKGIDEFIYSINIPAQNN